MVKCYPEMDKIPFSTVVNLHVKGVRKDKLGISTTLGLSLKLATHLDTHL
jgi:hypothetical protein